MTEIPGRNMRYGSIEIHYMSGTGNSFRAAAWMAERAKEKGADFRMYQVAKFSEGKEPAGGSCDLLGMVFPTHAFTAPWLVIRHALRLPRGRGRHAFVVATRAGTRIASVPLPGLEGTAAYLVALILFFKGYGVRGVRGLDMPSNWMSLHWGLSPVNAKFIIERAKAEASSFIKAVLEGKSVFRGFIPLVFGLILGPVSLGYLVVGRFFLSKLFFASETCTGCGQCARNCPAGAIKMSGGGEPRPYWTFSCESCMRCMGYCPEKSVEAGHSIGIILYFIATLPAPFLLLSALGDGLASGISFPLALFALKYVYILVSLFLSYLLLSWLIRIPLVNRLFTFTTLTHFYRRYHEPDTALQDFKAGNVKG